jgi:protein SCO1/2
MSVRAAVTAVAVAVLVAGCGSSAPKGKAGASPKPAPAPKYHGAVATPPVPAAPLALPNYDGKRVTLAQYRGKAVLVTFIYTHCPDVCPLIVGNLRTVQAKLGPEARKLQVIAVSVDPKGDTPATVGRFLRSRDMLGRMDYLIGSRPQLEATWKRWRIAERVPRKSPELVEHSALVYGISASGKLTTLYPSNFKPADVSADVPQLAAR